jgi:hypothetical protein
MSNKTASHSAHAGHMVVDVTTFANTTMKFFCLTCGEHYDGNPVVIHLDNDKRHHS